MNEVIQYINKAESVEDQVIIGLTRLSSNINTALILLNAAKQANIGNDANGVIDALLGFAGKLQVIVGCRQ